MDLTLSPDNAVTWERRFDTGEADVFRVKAQDIRREKTGLHAQVSLGFRDMLLAYDTFNIGRDEDRRRLVKSAHSHLKNGMGEIYPQDMMRHDLDLFCRLLPKAWEEDRFEVCRYNADEDVPPVKSVLDPYILEGAGTIVFAPPGSGKSYTFMTMGLSIATGLCSFWLCEERDVLYVNLERSAVSMRRRFRTVAVAMGITGQNHRLEFLHAKGLPFTAISRKLRQWKVSHPEGILLVDSISRAGYGSLNEDETANKIIDFLNQYGTWGAIGHTPRADSDHVYGSIHFDAGEDIGIKLVSEEISGALGVSLEVVKGNDIAKPPIYYMAFEFGPDGLKQIRKARIGEFAKLIEAKPLTNVEKVSAYLGEVGEATATQVAKATGVPRPKVADLFSKSDKFCLVRREKQNVFYGLTLPF